MSLLSVLSIIFAFFPEGKVRAPVSVASTFLHSDKLIKSQGTK